MLATLRQTLGRASDVRNRVVRTYAALIAFNVAVWAIALLLAQRYPLLLPTALLAYSFGLRHAVDADHIAAIDNTTRKLMQDGQRPVGVGLFFSLGHSTVVVVLTIVVAISAGFMAELPTLQSIGSLIGTIVSAAFLLLIGTINLVVLIDIYRMFRRVASGGAYDEESLEDFLANRGLLARLLRPMLRIVRRSWHMYPLGLLFGLGFDTASEVALLGLAATTGVSGLPVIDILILPALFAAGMSLVDTTDGILMLGAYGWAYFKPIRKLYYNLTITLMSVLVAFLIGGIEVLGIVADRFDLHGGAWDWLGSVDFGILGFAIVAIFAVSWIASTALYRWKAWDDLPVIRGDRGERPARDRT